MDDITEGITPRNGNATVAQAIAEVMAAARPQTLADVANAVHDILGKPWFDDAQKQDRAAFMWSVTLLLGFVPGVFERDDAGRDVRIVHFDEIRPTDPNRVPSDFQLTGLAMFGFCREAIRRRVKPLVQCFCKRREED